MAFADPRDANYIASANKPHAATLATDYTALGVQLQRRGIAIDDITRAVANFRVAVPSWGVGTGGTRFGRRGSEGITINGCRLLQNFLQRRLIRFCSGGVLVN